MGKRHNKGLFWGDPGTNAIVDIEGDIMRNKDKGEYESGVVTPETNDATKLSDMAREYERIRESLEKHPTVEDEERAKREERKGGARVPKLGLGEGILDLDDEDDFAMTDVVLGAVTLGVVVIGVACLCVAGVKGIKVIRRLL